MTQDDRNSTTPGTPSPAGQGGLPDDAGNDMAGRSGHYDESESSRTDTATFPGNPGGDPGTPGSGALPGTGTTFGTGGDDQGI